MIGVFGSAFNPPTLGHDDAIKQALDKLDKVILVPSALHPWGKKMVDFNLRITMLQTYVETAFPCGRVQVSDIERTLAQTGQPVFTWQLMASLDALYPNEKLIFLCGPDVEQDWDKFQKAAYIRETWGVMSVSERRTIRSTLVRKNIETGNPIKGLVAPAVEAFILSNHLYR